MKNIPNILSSMRLLMVGVFMWLFKAGKYLPALCVFVVACLTDALDGFLARRNHWTSDVGKLLDPLADKCMTLAALWCIYSGKRDTIYLALFALMLVKELTLLIGGLMLKRKRQIVVYADWPGKVATSIFGVGIGLALLSFKLPAISPWDQVALYFAAGLSCYALVYYAIWQWSNLFPKWADRQRREKPPQSDGKRLE